MPALRAPDPRVTFTWSFNAQHYDYQHCMIVQVIAQFEHIIYTLIQQTESG